MKKNNRLIATKRAILKHRSRQLNIPVKNLRWNGGLLQKQNEDGHWAPLPGVKAVLRNS